MSWGAVCRGVLVGLNVKIEHPVIAPAALSRCAHGVDRRFAGSVAVGVGMKHRLQEWLQVTTGDFLGDSVGHCWHGHIELHLVPANFWGRLRLLTPFIPSVVRSLAS